MDEEICSRCDFVLLPVDKNCEGFSNVIACYNNRCSMYGVLISKSMLELRQFQRRKHG